jgi:tetratricopeptide (TPR) repeat protein
VYAMNHQVGEKQSKAPAISLNELSRRLFSPYEIPKPSGDEAGPSDPSLSYIAWKLKQDIGANNDKSSSSSTFPLFSYLDLRRQQNTAWATDRLTEGNAILFEDARKAENLYKQGLDLVPDHVELLVSYGKLLAQTKRRPLAITKFQRALKVDPDCVSAYENLERARQHEILLRQGSRKVAAPVLRESSAFQDVLLERSLAHEAPAEEEEQEVTEGELRDDERKHKKRRRKKHKRRRRGRSPSPTPSSSSDDASESSSRRDKKRKRNHPSPSLSSAGEEDPHEYNSSREERRRHRKHRKHHKHRSKRKHKKRKRSDSSST